MSGAYNAGGWHDFAIGLLSASAALLGLFLVAMSLHLKEIEQNEAVRNRARITLAGLIVSISVSLALLAPNQSTRWLGAR